MSKMKPQTQNSLLKWAALLSGRQITSIVDIQNTDLLVLLLNKLQPLTFQQLYQIDQRASNSVLSILKFINSYYKKQLNCNISQIIDGLNIFKNPLQIWQLLIGVAIKGKHRDANINVILQMELQQQSQLMLLVQDVIQKLNEYDMGQNNKNHSQISDSSDSKSIRGRKPSNFSHFNAKRDEFLNQLIEQNQTLKQKNIQLHNQLSQQRSMQQQIKKSYEQRLNHFKTQRYQFLQALTEGSSAIQSNIRSRKKSQFNFRQSMKSNESSKIFDDPLHDLNISIAGSLPDIANDLLNAVKNCKKQTEVHIQKSSLLQDHIKDLKLSMNRLSQQNKILKEEFQKCLQLQKQLQNVRKQNQELLKNQTELLKMMNQVQEQKHYLREMVDKLKQQKNLILKNFNKGQQSVVITDENKNSAAQKGITSSNSLGLTSSKPGQSYDIMRAPSIILRQMSSQFQHDSYNLNEEIDDIKNPMLRDKYEKQMDELKQKNNILRQQNNELKQMNKMLQKTVHKSMQKSQQIQKNIEQGYRALFEIKSSIIEPASQEKQQNSPVSPILINVSRNSNIWIESDDKQKNKNEQNEMNQKKQKQNKKQNKKNIQIQQNKQNQKDSKIVDFYQQVKKIVESYEQKQLLMLIEIESLKAQLNKVMNQKKQNLTKIQNNEIQIIPSQHVQMKKQRKQLSIKGKVIQQKFESNQFIKQQIKQEQQITIIKKSQFIQRSQMQQVKQQSVLMFNINISGPGGKNEQNEQNQQYKIRKSQLENKNKKQLQIKQRSENKRNRQLYPSQQFIEIQQGQELNENDFPKINYKRKSQNSVQNEQECNNLSNELNKRSSIQQNKGLMHLQITNNNKNINMISGIGQRFSKDQRRSIFARSGFYNQSFVELSNRLQFEIEQDMNEITEVLQQKSKLHRMNNKYQKNRQIDTHNQQQLTRQQNQNSELIQRLQRIKSSYMRIQQYHINSSQQIQSQLKQQLLIQKSQLIQLKIYNQSLKQQLNKIICQRQLLVNKIKSIQLLLNNIHSNQQLSQLYNKFKIIFNDIAELQFIMPQLETFLEGSKVKQLQLLYAKEKYQKQRLQQQIYILMETLVYFRNIALDQNQSI